MEVQRQTQANKLINMMINGETLSSLHTPHDSGVVSLHRVLTKVRQMGFIVDKLKDKNKKHKPYFLYYLDTNKNKEMIKEFAN